MSQRRRRIRTGLIVIATIAVVIAALLGSYQTGFVGAIGDKVYKNNSPLVTSSRSGISVSLAHSRYFTTDTITLKLINLSSDNIYLPGLLIGGLPSYIPYLRAPSADSACFAIETEFLGSRGWQELGRGCYRSWGCGGGANLGLPAPVALELEPGETATFPLYDGQSTYPPWTTGAYRFSVLYTSTPLVAPRYSWPRPLALPDGVSLSTPFVTLTNAWWYPPLYHQTAPSCGLRA